MAGSLETLLLAHCASESPPPPPPPHSTASLSRAAPAAHRRSDRRRRAARAARLHAADAARPHQARPPRPPRGAARTVHGRPHAVLCRAACGAVRCGAPTPSHARSRAQVRSRRRGGRGAVRAVLAASDAQAGCSPRPPPSPPSPLPPAASAPRPLRAPSPTRLLHPLLTASRAHYSAALDRPECARIAVCLFATQRNARMPTARGTEVRAHGGPNRDLSAASGATRVLQGCSQG
jgi:hypothetical protein